MLHKASCSSYLNHKQERKQSQIVVRVLNLAVPSNITIVPLPAKCPELNPVETVWQFMRDNLLSNRVFRSYDAIVDHCCYAWNQLADRPWRVMSIGMRE